jgi:hypothetical protein
MNFSCIRNGFWCLLIQKVLAASCSAANGMCICASVVCWNKAHRMTCWLSSNLGIEYVMCIASWQWQKYSSVTVSFVLSGYETLKFPIILNEHRLNIFVSMSGIFQNRNDEVLVTWKLWSIWDVLHTLGKQKYLLHVKLWIYNCLWGPSVLQNHLIQKPFFPSHFQCWCV